MIILHIFNSDERKKCQLLLIHLKGMHTAHLFLVDEYQAIKCLDKTVSLLHCSVYMSHLPYSAVFNK